MLVNHFHLIFFAFSALKSQVTLIPLLLALVPKEVVPTGACGATAGVQLCLVRFFTQLSKSSCVQIRTIASAANFCLALNLKWQVALHLLLFFTQLSKWLFSPNGPNVLGSRVCLHLTVQTFSPAVLSLCHLRKLSATFIYDFLPSLPKNRR